MWAGAEEGGLRRGRTEEREDRGEGGRGEGGRERKPWIFQHFPEVHLFSQHTACVFCLHFILQCL